MSDKGKPQDNAALEDRVADLEVRVTALESDYTELSERVLALEEGESTPPPDIEEPPPDVEQPPPSSDDSLQELVQNGGPVTLPKATYNEFCTVSKATQITGQPTTIDVSGITIGNQKGIFEVDADIELSDLTLIGARVPDMNGTAVRGGVGAAVVMQNCEITGNQMGILVSGGGADIEISNCNFHDNGTGGENGRLGHEIYCSAVNKEQYGETDFMIRDSKIIGGPRTSIALKVRATRISVSNCEIRGSTSNNGNFAGRPVDFPDGGDILIENSLIELRASSPTGSILGYLTENTSQGVGSVTLRNVQVIDSRGRGGEFWARAGTGAKLILENCTYTANAAPTLTGWASVTGQFTKA